MGDLRRRSRVPGDLFASFRLGVVLPRIPAYQAGAVVFYARRFLGLISIAATRFTRVSYEDLDLNDGARGLSHIPGWEPRGYLLFRM